LLRSKADVFAFIDSERQAFAVSRLCALFNVTRTGYYAWRGRGPCARARQDRVLSKHILETFQASNGTYGSPRIHRALQVQGIHISRRRVERLMQEAGLRARIARIYRSNPKLHKFRGLPNRLRGVKVTAPDQVWLGDVTYLHVGGQWRYLAVVMDRYSRRLLGWSLSRRRDVQLTKAALTHAVRQRRPRPGFIFHSDRGVEYAGHLFRKQLDALGALQSMNQRSLGDNAEMESFFHSFKADAVHGLSFKDELQMRAQLLWYVPFYNQRRMHSANDYRSPVDYERHVS
jgi:putative transposase